MEDKLVFLSKENSEWAELVKNAVSGSSEIHFFHAENKLLEFMKDRQFDRLIIESKGYSKLAAMISRIKSENQGIKIIIATSSLTWSRTKELIQAGATDVIFKTMDSKRIQKELSLKGNNG